MISIIIPTFQPNKYINSCLESIKNQTISKDLLEIIIILNGSRYPYETNIIELINKYSLNIKYYYTNNIGVSNARNIGINNSSGEYIFFLDDDDVLSPNYLNQMLALAQPSIIIASNVYSFYNELDEHIKDYLTYKESGSSIIQRRKYLSNSCCKLIPKNIISTKRFNVNFQNGEDALFMFSISNKIKQIIIEKECIYYRRLRPNSASRKKVSFTDRMKRILKQQLEYTKIYFSNPLEYNFLLYLTRLLAVFKQ